MAKLKCSQNQPRPKLSAWMHCISRGLPQGHRKHERDVSSFKRHEHRPVRLEWGGTPLKIRSVGCWETWCVSSEHGRTDGPFKIWYQLVGGLEHFLFSMSYMGCHPSHWRSFFFRGVGLNHQPVKGRSGRIHVKERFGKMIQFDNEDLPSGYLT